jgi:hypothetical protein
MAPAAPTPLQAKPQLEPQYLRYSVVHSTFLAFLFQVATDLAW